LKIIYDLLFDAWNIKITREKFMLHVQINYMAIVVTAMLVFALGALWYSPLLFAKSWMSVIGKTEEELKKGSKPANHVILFMQGLISAYILSIFIGFAQATTLAAGAWVGFMCWFGFAGTTSFVHGMFSLRPIKLWAIDTGYTFVSFIVSGMILATWK
jgi:hypothetical protein